MTKPKTIRLYPVPGVFLHPWSAVEFDATPEQWAELREYLPPPFTDKPPGGKTYLVGEQGPELIVPTADARVVPNKDDEAP